MKSVLDVGAIAVLFVIALAFWQKYSAQLIAASNPNAIANLNRANADTSLMYQAGQDALSKLQTWIPTAPYGGSQG